MKSDIKKIIIRMAILTPLLLGAILFIKPMTAKAWSWYNPFSWPVWETVDSAITDISDYFVTPDEDLPLNGRLVARVMVEGEDGSKDFYSHVPIAWNYAVARALEGKKVSVRLEDNWIAREERTRTQYPSEVEGGTGEDREWLILYQYDLGTRMRRKDIPFLNSSESDYVDAFWRGGIYIPENCNITLDLNGHLIWRKADYQYISDGQVMYVDEGATFTIIDSNPRARWGWSGGYIYGGGIKGGSSREGAGGIQIMDGATVYIEGGNIWCNSSSNDGGAIKIDGEKARLFIDGTLFMQNMASDAVIERNYGGAIACYDAKVEIRNARFFLNTAENRGGALFVDDGQLTLINCTFESNFATIDYGGGLYLSSGKYDPRSLLEDNTFIKNDAKKDGGAMYLNASARTDIFRTKCTGNYASRNGGAVYVNKSGSCFSNAYIADNNAKGNGGGVYVDSTAKLNLIGKIEITDNSRYENDHFVDNNLCLQDGVSSTAFVNNYGLESGSKIGIHSTEEDPGSKGVVLSNSITEYAAREYFTPDRNATWIKLDETEEKTEFYQASMIGEDAKLLIILGSVAGLMLVITVIVYIKKRKVVTGDGETD